MKQISILRKSITQDTSGQAYILEMEINAAEEITPDLFLKQRVSNFDGTTTDNFIGVATPVDIEDYPAKAPGTESSIFRDNIISLVSPDPTLLQESLDTILYELELLVDQATVLDNLSADAVYTITAASVSTVPVPPITLVSIALTPLDSSLVRTYGRQFTLTGTFSDGTDRNVTRYAVWEVSDGTIANFDSLPGFITSYTDGTVTVSARYGGQTAETTLTVVAPP